jgi:predicted metal-dependent phosphoesterase TrpH
VAVTDHNTIAGALRLKEIAPEQVIIGEEIGTTHGELIAFFLSEPVPAGLAPLEAAEAVRAQGGVVGASHPLDRIRRDAMGRDVLLNLLGHLDFLEVFNARCLFPADNRAARNLAEEAELFMTGGSDAHCAWELGRGVTILPPFDSAASFLSGLSEARVQGRRTPVWIHLISSYAKIARHLGLPRSPDPWERDC